MENEEKRSKWDELARTLGAEIPAEAPPRREFTPVEPPSEPKPQVPREKPRRASSGWDSLATDFGLEVKAPPVPQPPIVEEVDEVEEVVDDFVIESRSYEEIEEVESPSDELEIDRYPREEPYISPRQEPYIEARQEQPKTLWERIFGSSTESQSPRDPEIREEITPDEVTERSRQWQPSGEFDESVEARTDDRESPSTEERQGRPRRRRRRGGRSRSGEPKEQGRGRGERTVGDRPERARRPAPAKPREADRDDFDTLDDDDFGDDSDTLVEGTSESGESEAGGKNGSRNIPSWEEAIGFIVDTNLQTRSERRTPPRSGSRGGSSRGRGRRQGGRGPRNNN